MRIEINFDDTHLGRKVADSDDKTQVAFFKGFAQELLAFTSKADIEFQFFTVAKKLTPKEKELLQTALRCLWW